MTYCSLTSVFGRLLLLIVNLATGLAGLAFILIGVNGRNQAVSSPDIDWSATNMILIGSTILLLSCLGICASLVDWSLLLKAYAIILLVQVLLLTSLYLYVAVFFTTSAMNLAEQFFKSVMASFTEDSRSHLIVESIQKTLYCCGREAPADWHNVSGNSTSGSLLPFGYYPASCCNRLGVFNDSASSLCQEKDLLFTSGCFSPVQVARYVHSLTAYYLVVLTGLLLLVLTAGCLERDQQLHTAKRINRQFAAHMETCRSTRSNAWLYGTKGRNQHAQQHNAQLRAFY